MKILVRIAAPVSVVLATVASSGCAKFRSRSADAGQGEPPALSLSITQTGLPEASTQRPVQQNDEAGPESSRLQAGDPVIVNLRGIYPKDEMIEDIIDEQGNLSLPHIGNVVAAGKSTARLESDIRKLYIDGGYYRSITVNVVTPQRACFIRGEVRTPGRFTISGGMTILQAIAAAGGYTEFASPRSVKLIRGNTTQELNMRTIEKNPEQDIRLESGDVIVVGRSIF